MRSIYFILLGIIVTGRCLGQIGFENHTVVDASKIRSVFAADLDGDGAEDLLSALENHDKIVWYRNLDSLGTFGDYEEISVDADGAMSVFAADIDGDGDNDVLSASFHDNKIAWYENMDGQGIFGTEQIISSVALEAVSVIAGDLDGDGDIDVIQGSKGNIIWYENVDGQGSFNEHLVSSQIGHHMVKFADIDGDGDMDILSRSEYNFGWFRNDGVGVFTAESISNGSVNSIDAADIDGDGDLDLMFAKSSFNSKEVSWYENLDGQGDFGNKTVIESYYPQQSGKPHTVLVMDLDGDSDVDLLCGFESSIHWHENVDGFGSFGNSQNLLHGRGAQFIAKGDLNNDEKNDAIVITFKSDEIAWFSTWIGAPILQQVFSKNAAGVIDVHVADIDNDGDLDLVSASSWDHKVAWYDNEDGHGNYSEQKVIPIDAGLAKSVTTGDLDGDGDLDIVSAETEVSGKILWYKNVDGQGNFDSVLVVSPGLNWVKDVKVGDIDGDGDMDIVSGGTKIYWHKNLDGLDSFELEQYIYKSSGIVQNLFILDMDTDGDVDILFADHYTVGWIENTDGLGNFGDVHTIGTGIGVVFPADMDGDGDIDIITKGGQSVVWYENDGAANFSNEQTVANENVSSILALDMDGDGDLDVVATQRWLKKSIWYENVNGAGVFGSKQVIINGFIAESLEYGDLDGDGDLDIVHPFWQISSIVWSENKGNVLNEIFGQLNYDLNSNSCDTLDLPISNLLVKTSNGDEELATLSLHNGLFQLFPGEGEYTTSISTSLPSYFSINPVSQVSNFNGIGSLDSVSFCIEPNQTINDLNISFIPKSASSPGFDAHYRIVYSNVGTTELSGSIEFVFDKSKLTFVAASEMLSNQTSNILIFSFEGLKPFESRFIDIDFKVLVFPMVNLGDELLFEATIKPELGDFTPDDNVITFSQTVVGSFDPNDISVMEGDKVAIEDVDKYLHYVIRFQNTGTAPAVKVRVNNILDPNLDWTTLQVESASHDSRVEIINGDTVNFIFDAIYLSDSTHNEPNSHGFVAYRIKPKADVIMGTVILNQADIYFDFNLPVVTNEVSTEFVEALAISANELEKFSIYPIPTTGRLSIQSATGIKAVRIYDNLGQLVLVFTNKRQIDVSSLEKGIYICKLTDLNGMSGVLQFVKE